MELVNEFVNNQIVLYLPVALVLVAAILVFAFGFKSAEQPPFDKLSSIDNEERKSLAKKKKLKEKKSPANGNVVNVIGGKTDKSPSKNTKKKEQTDSSKKVDNNKAKLTVDKKKNDKLVEDKLKKSVKTKIVEDNAITDEGNWETVPAKGDKKKKQDSPAKKEKKVKKTETPTEVDKMVKEVINKELQESDSTSELPSPLAKEVEPKSEISELKIEPLEVKKEKKPEKKSKKAAIDVTEDVQKEKVETVAVPPAPAKQQPSPAKSEQAPTKPQETSTKEPVGSVAFDELGDVWTEAKQPKKNKKKSRRDN